MTKNLLLKKLRKSLGLTQKELADELEIPAKSYQRYENGGSPISSRIAIKLSEISGLSTDYILGVTSTPNVTPAEADFVQIPLYGDVSAGLGSYASGDPPTDWQNVEKSMISGYHDYLCLKVDGDSMEPLLLDGDIILVRCQSVVDDGDIGVALVDGDRGLVKKIYMEHGKITLIPLNSDYKPETFVNEECDRVKILGRVERIVDRKIN